MAAAAIADLDGLGLVFRRDHYSLCQSLRLGIPKLAKHADALRLCFVDIVYRQEEAPNAA